jgi:hypothetical protein
MAEYIVLRNIVAASTAEASGAGAKELGVERSALVGLTPLFLPEFLGLVTPGLEVLGCISWRKLQVFELCRHE